MRSRALLFVAAVVAALALVGVWLALGRVAAPLVVETAPAPALETPPADPSRVAATVNVTSAGYAPRTFALPRTIAAGGAVSIVLLRASGR